MELDLVVPVSQLYVIAVLDLSDFLLQRDRHPIPKSKFGGDHIGQPTKRNVGIEEDLYSTISRNFFENYVLFFALQLKKQWLFLGKMHIMQKEKYGQKR
jgi:hypothetical protein